MFQLISDAYAQTTQAVTDATTKATEVATNNWEIGLIVVLVGVVALLGYRYWRGA